jgi:hypothetical protein
MRFDFHGVSPFIGFDPCSHSLSACAVTRSNAETKPSVGLRVLRLYPKSFTKLGLMGVLEHRVARIR